MFKMLKNKKQFIIGLVVGLLFSSVGVGAAVKTYTLTQTPYKVKINGTEYKNTDYPILTYKSKLYVPLDELSDELNIESKINSKTKTVTIEESEESQYEATTFNGMNAIYVDGSYWVEMVSLQYRIKSDKCDFTSNFKEFILQNNTKTKTKNIKVYDETQTIRVGNINYFKYELVKDFVDEVPLDTILKQDEIVQTTNNTSKANNTEITNQISLNKDEKYIKGDFSIILKEIKSPQIDTNGAKKVEVIFEIINLPTDSHPSTNFFKKISNNTYSIIYIPTKWQSYPWFKSKKLNINLIWDEKLL